MRTNELKTASLGSQVTGNLRHEVIINFTERERERETSEVNYLTLALFESIMTHTGNACVYVCMYVCLQMAK